MKKAFALLAVTLALAATSCSTTRCCHKQLSLAGDWKMGGPYNIGQTCHVLQAGNDLTFINEKGDKSGGVLVGNRSLVIALDWEGGLTGQLTEGTQRINWRNGTWWLKSE